MRTRLLGFVVFVGAVAFLGLTTSGAAQALPCVGDCNGNGEVVINELITGVNIAVGSARLDQCPTFDRNGSGEVEINELIQGVNAALNGCAA